MNHRHRMTSYSRLFTKKAHPFSFVKKIKNL